MLPKMCGAAAQLVPSARRAAIRQVLRCSAAAASLPLVPHSCVTGAAGCWEVAHTPAASNYGALVTGGARGLCSVALDSGDAGPGYVTIMTPDGQSQEVSDDIDSKTSEAALVFNEAWDKLEREVGWRGMLFPKEIIWLAGAPGAGKGTNSRHIMTLRGLTAPPIETSALLNTPEMQRKKDAGILISDRDVIEAVLRALLHQRNRYGVIVDGFPRTFIQAECIKLLHARMMELRDRSMHDEDENLRAKMRRPVFHITVLYVDEEESIKRQMQRAAKMDKANQVVKDTGWGRLEAARATDVDEALARKRFRDFKHEVVDALNSIKEAFPFHLIAANGSPEDVKRAIAEEFAYQSSMDLGDDTFEMIRAVRTSAEIVRHARQSLIQRLNTYAREHHNLFQQVIDLLKADFMHIVQRQALAGSAIVRSQSPLFEDPVAVNIALDVLAERGYWVTLDVVRYQIPESIDFTPGAASLPVKNAVQRSFVFTIEFDKPNIRGGVGFGYNM